jgi:hypothetical protein
LSRHRFDSSGLGSLSPHLTYEVSHIAIPKNPELYKFKKGKVYLQDRDGKEIAISPNKLAREDQKYYRELVKRQNDPQYHLFRKLNGE